MPFPDFDPILIHIGPLAIRWYALAYIAGIVLGWWYAGRLVKNAAVWAPGKPPLTTVQLDDLVLYITLGIILGGRLGYALFYQPHMYSALFTGHDWTERLALFRLWDGGMAFHGGAAGVTVALIWFGLKHRVNPLSLGDLVAPVVPIGLGFGRLANFINGELWGRVSDVPWAMNFCNKHAQAIYGALCEAPGGSGVLPRHPSQLYEALLEGVLLLSILAFGIYKLGLLRKPGYITGVFLVGYGLIRASLETVRQPDFGLDHLPLGLTMGMILSVPMILVGAWLIQRAWSRPPVPAAV